MKKVMISTLPFARAIEPMGTKQSNHDHHPTLSRNSQPIQKATAPKV